MGNSLCLLTGTVRRRQRAKRAQLCPHFSTWAACNGPDLAPGEKERKNGDGCCGAGVANNCLCWQAVLLIWGAQSCNPSSALLQPLTRLPLHPALLSPRAPGSSASPGSQVQALSLPTLRWGCACGAPELLWCHGWDESFFCAWGDAQVLSSLGATICHIHIFVVSSEHI